MPPLIHLTPEEHEIIYHALHTGEILPMPNDCKAGVVDHTDLIDGTPALLYTVKLCSTP